VLPQVNALVSAVKKVFKKAPSRIAAFRRWAPGVPLPPEPVLTRWGTWLEAVEYYSKHVLAVQSVLQHIADNEAKAVGKAKLAVQDTGTRAEIAYIHANFGFIPNLIRVVESRGVRLSESLLRVDESRGLLRGVAGRVPELVHEKLDSILLKNEGLETLRLISAVLTGDSKEPVPQFEFTPEELALFQFAPVVSCDVERTFSQYKAVLRDNRQSFAFEHLRLHLLIYCNK
jgi:hypothetical protein